MEKFGWRKKFLTVWPHAVCCLRVHAHTCTHSHTHRTPAPHMQHTRIPHNTCTHTCTHTELPHHTGTHAYAHTHTGPSHSTCSTDTHARTVSLSHTLSLTRVHSVFSHTHSCTQMLSPLTHGTLFCSSFPVLIFPDFTLFSLQKGPLTHTHTHTHTHTLFYTRLMFERVVYLLPAAESQPNRR